MNAITINGVTFELPKNPDDYLEWPESFAKEKFSICGANHDEIEGVYRRPSSAKVKVWHSWCKWCEDINNMGYQCELHISSPTCNFFSISGYVIDYSGPYYYNVWITKAHNRLTPIVVVPDEF